MLGFESEYTKKNETKALYSHGFLYICDTKTIVYYEESMLYLNDNDSYSGVVVSNATF